MTSSVRVLVARSVSGTRDPLGTLAALSRLGRGAEVDLVRSAPEALARCESGEIDVVVAERGPGAPCDAILAALRGSGPPVIAVCPGGDLEALEAFRLGAADCVLPGPESALPQTVLEQVRRWRVARERSSAERRIRDLESYNENIIQNLSSALVGLDTQGRITLCNAAAEAIFGAPAEALRGRPIREWVGEGGVPDPALRDLAAGVSVRAAETRVRRADGHLVPVSVSSSPLADPDGRRLGAVAILEDLTEVEQLHHRVLQSEKMASIGQLAAGVAHEINNPMGFIHANLFQMAEYVSDLRRVWGHVEALQKTVAGGSAEEVGRGAGELAAASEEVDVAFVISDLAKAVRESQEGSERIRHIVQDLRDFSHQDTGERMPADVNECLDSTANIVWPMMKHLVELERSYADLPLVPCLPMQLKQVFMNLLVNAYQSIEERAAASGGGGRIELRTELREGGVAIVVTDDGVGIAPENQGRIFDPFFTTKKVGAGTGLGLSTSFHIVERHGGRLTVESEPGALTTFEVWLPLDVERDADAWDEPGG